MRRALCIGTSLLAALAIGACGSDDDGSDGDDGPTIAATTGIIADITENLAGTEATVEQIIPDGSSPHDFQLSAEDRQKLEQADLLVYNGADLEAGLPVDEVDVPKFVLTEHVGELLPFEEDGETGEDPHVWMDPTKVATALPDFAEALADADPNHADGYRQRAETYGAELTTLDGEIENSISAIPEQNRELVTSHDALGYFADRYGFEVVATPFPASGPEAEPSAAKISEVEDAVEESGVPAVFAQEDDDPEVLELVADETGVGIVTDLLVEAPGSAGTYVEMLRHDAELLNDNLGG